MKALLSGNEAVARGAYEAGVEIAAAYPGTPSTEILESIATYDEIYAEWSVNEKIAFEIALGGALGGKRALAAMKHVGVNVASDALMTAVYVGVNRGLVLVSADDPGIHSSQSEQDNRRYAKMANIPMLEPSDSQEAKEFTILAYELSEGFDTPVMLRMTTRVCHGKSVVTLGKRRKISQRPYEKSAEKHVMLPANARIRHQVTENRLKRLEAFSETFDGNRIEIRDPAIGIIAGGVAYQYAKEVIPEASFFKLGMTNPLPVQALNKFARSVERLYVIEELEPFLEEQLRAMGLNVIGKEILPRTGEFSPELLRERLLGGERGQSRRSSVTLPGRPPVMCPGCSHRGVFYVLKKLKALVSGDIGCYTLSAMAPLETMDTCVCMGASIGVAQGLRRAMEKDGKQRIVAVLGDSTFIHSGIPSLVNAVYNRAKITVVVLDNRTTAMTGLQDHPGTGRTLMGHAATVFDFEAIARAAGVELVETVDPAEVEETEQVIRQALEYPGLAVVIARRACILVERDQFSGTSEVVEELCSQCNQCLQLGCPAISITGESIVIDPILCSGCELCAKICPSNAITKIEEE